METFYSLIYLLFSLFCIGYFLLIAFHTYGWFTMKEFKTTDKPSVSASIIIPARNEMENIANCLSDILNQSYSSNFFEIIVVDDHSDDQTSKTAKNILNNYQNGKVISLPDTEKGKKAAIKTGVDNASGKLIITTDADCRFNKDWLKSIVSFYEAEKPKIISGPVAFHNEKNAFEKMQSLEFMSLIASGAGAISIGAPILCNGANLAYEKKAFEAVNGFKSDSQYFSGDDIFLLLKIRKRFGKDAIRFIKDKNSIVYSLSQKTLKSFIQQRIRWVSKSKGYTNLAIILASLLVYLFNYGIFAGLILSIWFEGLFLFSVILFIIKLLIDLPIMTGISLFMKKAGMLWYYIPVQILYLPYVSIIGFIGNFITFKWKGRKAQ